MESDHNLCFQRAAYYRYTNTQIVRIEGFEPPPHEPRSWMLPLHYILNCVLKWTHDLLNFFASDDANKKHDYCHYEKYMDEPTDGVHTNNSQEPKNQKNESDCCKHKI